MSQPLYFKPNAVVEPLLNKWYAWAHLVSPATCAMNIANRHITIMDSYIAEPELHHEAVKNPKMLGGPFMDFPRNRTTEISELKDHTLSDLHDLIDLNRAINELDNLLTTKAKGFGLESLYGEIPVALRGYVELFYDRNNQAGFRFFESLLYKSKFYRKELQTVSLWLTENDHRPFCFSTPRLEYENALHLPISFNNDLIDELSKMKRQPGEIGRFIKLLGLDTAKADLFRSFFTYDAPKEYRTYMGDKIRMRYFGHACILVETKDVSILIDPLVAYYGYDADVDRFTDMDLPGHIDYVLITHNHQDHVVLETLLALRHKIGTIVVPHTNSGRLEDPDLALMLRNIGFQNVVALDEFSTVTFKNATITAIPFVGEHSDLNIQTKSCYLAQISEFRLLFMADSRNVEPELYRKIGEQLEHPVDVLFLGMECDGAPMSWLYGPLFTKKIPRDQDMTRRLAGSDYEKGLSLVEIFRPKELYVYAMGMEPWLEFISSVRYTNESHPIIQSDKLVSRCREMGIIAERLFGEKELLYSF